MLLIADEDFDNDILRGLLRRHVEVDIVRVQDVGLSGSDDPTILAWAAQEGRVLLTHDVNTMPAHAYERMRTGESIAGVILVPQSISIGNAIEDILIIVMAAVPQEFENQVVYLSL
jgi:predicted nuclease of predicted toxin-antitoxin system